MLYCRALEVVGGWAVIGLAAGRPRHRKPRCGRLTTSLADYPISAERCWCFHYSLAIADLDPANSANNVVCTARDSLGPLAHWAGANSLIKFGASIRHDDPALVRLARGRSWPVVVPKLVYRATRRSLTRIWSWLMRTIWPTVASRASSPRASVRPNTHPNGGEWAEISVPVRHWSIEAQREGIFGWRGSKKSPVRI